MPVKVTVGWARICTALDTALATEKLRHALFYTGGLYLSYLAGHAIYADIEREVKVLGLRWRRPASTRVADIVSAPESPIKSAQSNEIKIVVSDARYMDAIVRAARLASVALDDIVIEVCC